MAFEVNIDAEAINKHVADAIIGSAIGAAIKAAIEKEVRALSSSYDNPLQAVIRDEIKRIAASIILNEHQETIAATVREAMTDKVTGEIIGRIIDAGLYPEKHR